MSKFTTEVRFICEVAAGYTESQGYNNVESIITEAAPSVFGNFPIYDENYRLPLETKILRHFYTREISEETVGLWKLRLNDKMNIIMPFYNKLYESELLKFNPFYDVDLTRDYKRNDTGTQAEQEQSNENERIRRNNSEIGNESSAEKGKEINQGNESENSNGIESNYGKNKSSGDSVGSFGESNVGKNKNNNVSSSVQNSNNSSIDANSDENSDWSLYSDTPQGSVAGLAGISGSGNYATGGDTGSGYLTNATHNFGTNSGVRNSNNVGNVKSEVEESGGSEREDNRIGNNSESFKNESENNAVREVGNSRVVSRDGGRNIDKTNVKQNSKNVVGDDNREKNAERGSESVISNLSQYIEHVVGKQGTASYSKMLLEFRDTFLNIDKMILKELEPLFFGLWE